MKRRKGLITPLSTLTHYAFTHSPIHQLETSIGVGTVEIAGLEERRYGIDPTQAKHRGLSIHPTNLPTHPISKKLMHFCIGILQTRTMVYFIVVVQTSH
jgi:hypothetical protein